MEKHSYLANSFPADITNVIFLYNKLAFPSSAKHHLPVSFQVLIHCSEALTNHRAFEAIVHGG
jgi:hypothetical protein